MVVDDAALDLLPQDEPELGRVGPDALGELVQGPTFGDLPLPAAGRRVAPASSVELRVGLTPTTLALDGAGDCLQAPVGIAAAPGA